MPLKKFGPSPDDVETKPDQKEDVEIKPDQKEDKEYYEDAIVNGIEISVGWDYGYKDYTIYFPQIDLQYARENEPGVSDQIIRITRNPEVAKQVFDFAVKKAEEVKDVYELYRAVDEFYLNLVSDVEGE